MALCSRTSVLPPASSATISLKMHLYAAICCNHFHHQELGLHQISAPGPVENRPHLQIQLRSKCSQILVFGRICKIAYTKLQRSVFQLISKNCAVGVAIFSIHLLTLLRSHHHLVTNEISHYEYCMQILNIHRV